MRNTKTKILSTTMLAGAAFAVSAPSAIAQQQQDTVDVVSVTGSRIVRADLVSPSPITTFSAADLEIAGVQTFEDIVENLTANTGGNLGGGVNNGSAGQADISLRGLGANRTLVLINGQRLPPHATNGVADLNLIPVGMIERVEVLRDGASTIYGSDAIAGVVNIITKQNFDGMELFVQHSRSDKGDGEVYRAGMTIGQTFDRGFVTVGVEYVDRDTVRQTDREFSACPALEVADAGAPGGAYVTCGGSPTSVPGRATVLDADPNTPGFQSTFFDDFLAANPNDPTPSNTTFVIDPGTDLPRRVATDGTDDFNFAAFSYLITPQEVVSAYGAGEYEMFSHDFVGTVSAFVDFHLSNRKSEQQLAPEGTFSTPVVPAWHPNNIFGGPVSISRRLVEVTSGRNFTQDAVSYRTVAGLRGILPNDWAWEVLYNYGSFTEERLNTGRSNPVRLFEVLCNDPASQAAMACSGGQSGSAPIWDPFREGTLTQEIQNHIGVPESPFRQGKKDIFQLNLSGGLGEFFEMPGGEIQWALGYENRREAFTNVPDGAASLGQIFFVAPNPTIGDFRVTEFYGEARVPILADHPFADILALEGSFRTSEYNVQGNKFDATNWKGAAEWAPIPDIRFRGTYATGFRAPSIGELFLPVRESAQSYTEPCSNLSGAESPVLIANCAADGIGLGDSSITATQATSLLGGNTQLSPEESNSFTVGLVLTPGETLAPQLQGLSLTVDFFDYSIKDAIGTAGTNNVIQGCYNSANFSSPLCNLIQGPTVLLTPGTPSPFSPRRNANNSVSGVILTNANLATFDVTGVDFALNYSSGLSEVTDIIQAERLFGDGSFDGVDYVVNIQGSYLEQYDYVPFAGADTVEAAGFIEDDQYQGNPAAFPEWRLRAQFGFTGGNWAAFWTARYMSEVEDPDADSTDLKGFAERVVYNDIFFSYDWEHFELSGGVKNLFDVEPPYLTNNDDMNTIQYSYDTFGRQLYIQGKVSF